MVPVPTPTSMNDKTGLAYRVIPHSHWSSVILNIAIGLLGNSFAEQPHLDTGWKFMCDFFKTTGIVLPTLGLWWPEEGEGIWKTRKPEVGL